MLIKPQVKGVKAVKDQVDGIVFTGGQSIHPKYYGRELPVPFHRIIASDRDEFEIALMQDVLENDVPMLGVCRGLQLLNVVQGGTLEHEIPGTTHYRMDHLISVERNTSLYEMMSKRGELLVNSLHYQRIENLGKDLVVTAVASMDNTIEALELPNHKFVIAVQWHPEQLFPIRTNRMHLDLFRQLSIAAQ